MSEPKWIQFVQKQRQPDRKTDRWIVETKLGRQELGEIAWFGKFRCYSYLPNPMTVYEQRCLRDIAEFCDEQTKAYREAKRVKC